MNGALLIFATLLAIPVALLVPPLQRLRRLGLHALEAAVNIAVAALAAAVVLFTLRLVPVPSPLADLAGSQFEQLSESLPFLKLLPFRGLSLLAPGPVAKVGGLRVTSPPPRG